MGNTTSVVDQGEQGQVRSSSPLTQELIIDQSCDNNIRSGDFVYTEDTIAGERCYNFTRLREFSDMYKVQSGYYPRNFDDALAGYIALSPEVVEQYKSWMQQQEPNNIQSSVNQSDGKKLIKTIAQHQEKVAELLPLLDKIVLPAGDDLDGKELLTFGREHNVNFFELDEVQVDGNGFPVNHSLGFSRQTPNSAYLARQLAISLQFIAGSLVTPLGNMRHLTTLHQVMETTAIEVDEESIYFTEAHLFSADGPSPQHGLYFKFDGTVQQAFVTSFTSIMTFELPYDENGDKMDNVQEVAKTLTLWWETCKKSFSNVPDIMKTWTGTTSTEAGLHFDVYDTDHNTVRLVLVSRYMERFNWMAWQLMLMLGVSTKSIVLAGLTGFQVVHSPRLSYFRTIHSYTPRKDVLIGCISWSPETTSSFGKYVFASDQQLSADAFSNEQRRTATEIRGWYGKSMSCSEAIMQLVHETQRLVGGSLESAVFNLQHVMYQESFVMWKIEHLENERMEMLDNGAQFDEASDQAFQTQLDALKRNHRISTFITRMIGSKISSTLQTATPSTTNGGSPTQYFQLVKAHFTNDLEGRKQQFLALIQGESYTAADSLWELKLSKDFGNKQRDELITAFLDHLPQLYPTLITHGMIYTKLYKAQNLLLDYDNQLATDRVFGPNFQSSLHLNLRDVVRRLAKVFTENTQVKLVPLSFFVDFAQGKHVNALLVDMTLRTIELFESHGAAYSTDNYKLIERLGEELSIATETPFRVLLPDDLCPAATQGSDSYCQTWRLLYFHMRCIFPELEPTKVMDWVLDPKHFRKDALNQFIRRYAFWFTNTVLTHTMNATPSQELSPDTRSILELTPLSDTKKASPANTTPNKSLTPLSIKSTPAKTAVPSSVKGTPSRSPMAVSSLTSSPKQTPVHRTPFKSEFSPSPRYAIIEEVVVHTSANPYKTPTGQQSTLKVKQAW